MRLTVDSAIRHFIPIDNKRYGVIFADEHDANVSFEDELVHFWSTPVAGAGPVQHYVAQFKGGTVLSIPADRNAQTNIEFWEVRRALHHHLRCSIRDWFIRKLNDLILWQLRRNKHDEEA